MNMRVTGTRRMNQRLEAMPRAVRRAFEEGLTEAGEEITAMQKRMVPVDQGNLRDSIRYERGRISRKRGLLGGATRQFVQDGNLSITIFTDDFKARWVEFGTTGQPPRPFFFPAMRALRRRVISRIRRKVNAAIRKEAAHHHG